MSQHFLGSRRDSASLLRWGVAALVLLALGALLHPGRGLACSEIYPGVSWVVLSETSGRVPPDSSLYLEIETDEEGAYLPPGLELRIDGSENALPLEIAKSEVLYRAHWFVRPEEGLRPDTDYVFTLWYDETRAYVFDEIAFRTGAAPDLEAPLSLASPELEGRFYRETLRGPCGSSEAVSFIRGDLELLFEVEADLYEMEVATEPTFAEPRRSYFRGSYVSYADPDLGRRERTYVRIRAIDLSGNVGPWTDVQEVRIALCAVAEDGPTGALSLLMMALAGLLGGRPRRRQTRG